MLDPLETKQIHGSKSTKRHRTNKSQKKIGAIFGGEFSDLGQKQQNQARKHGVGAPKRDQRGSLYQDDVGWNPKRPIFHERSGSQLRTRRTHGESQGKTQEEL